MNARLIVGDLIRFDNNRLNFKINHYVFLKWLLLIKWYRIIHTVGTQDFPKNLRTCAYHGVRNVSFSEKFAYVLNEWSLHTKKVCNSLLTHFRPIIHFYTPKKRQRLFEVFKGFRNGTLAWNGLLNFLFHSLNKVPF